MTCWSRSLKRSLRFSLFNDFKQCCADRCCEKESSYSFKTRKARTVTSINVFLEPHYRMKHGTEEMITNGKRPWVLTKKFSLRVERTVWRKWVSIHVLWSSWVVSDYRLITELPVKLFRNMFVLPMIFRFGWFTLRNLVQKATTWKQRSSVFHHRAFTAHNILNFFGTVVLFLLSYCILLYH